MKLFQIILIKLSRIRLFINKFSYWNYFKLFKLNYEELNEFTWLKWWNHSNSMYFFYLSSSMTAINQPIE